MCEVRRESRVIRKMSGLSQALGDTHPGVNITLGLPVIRVSVDHGTAFDVAGKGIASEAAMSLSIDYAVRMAKAQHKNK